MVGDPLVFVDAGPLVALFDRKDAYHAWALAKARELSTPFITTESVLSETCFLLQRSQVATEALFELLERESLRVDAALQAHMSEVAVLMKRYSDLPMSLADATLVRLAELHDNGAVFTVDHHFTIYRKNGRQHIPTIMPPAK